VRVQEPDPQVIRAAAQHDPAAFGEIVQAYQAHVWRFLCPDRGELEWIENGIVIGLRSRTLSLGELLRIASHLEPA
jgi:hypothetical protein